MSHPDEPDEVEEDFARPFLTSVSQADRPPMHAQRGTATMPSREPLHRVGDADWDEEAQGSQDGEFIRPYLVTGGRVHEGLGDFSTVYALSAKGRTQLKELSFESLQIAELCHEAQSVAEISAHLRLPLGVVTVLARDLSHSGYLAAASTAIDPASDITLITRLIHAVHAL
jgi:hypothetical protein